MNIQGNIQVNIQVTDSKIENEVFSLEQFTASAPLHISASERVPGVQGDAIDVKAWYKAWKYKHGAENVPDPTHLKVEGTDQFQAIVPWAELDLAFLLYAQDGHALEKGYPIRLYVPDGSSECLNVKSVIKLWFLHEASLGAKAAYGFKNTMTVDELKLNK
ncbi:hypothetical protein [Paenibacillus eucommiae]|uniref:Oxidoreductase molybdopterin-binding domain-containing protein n=1 Tax=Paenibacillus eucommiae TaxID=1355755 RepID=A0ABS4J7R9_9BACL|nr:hypothetical protein [Paenibacillus eucommiae]MBP1995892.1 hypothetical protein [Paenibacillus eucommiae]